MLSRLIFSQVHKHTKIQFVEKENEIQKFIPWESWKPISFKISFKANFMTIHA